MKTAVVFVVLATLGMCGCSTSMVMPSKAEHATMLTTQFNSPSKARPAEFTLVRDSGMIGSGCDFIFSVDSIPIARLGSSEGVTVWLSSGTHNVIVASSGVFLCGNYSVGQQVTLSAAHPIFFRVGLAGGNGQMLLQPMNIGPREYRP